MEKTRYLGISLYGSRRDEYASAVHSLLGGDLPPDWEWVNSSANSIVARRLTPPPAYYKEFLSRSPFESVKSLLRGSRCQRAVIRGEILKKKGFHSPKVHCWGKKGQRYFMVTEGIDAVSLSTHIEKHWIPPLSGKELVAKRKLIKKLGNEIGTLHRAGVCHGDLRLSNILVEEVDNNIVFHFIDNERNSYFSKVPRRLIKKNLVQVNMISQPNVTRQDRLRFFKAYNTAYKRFDPTDSVALIRQVQEKTLTRRARKRERMSRAAREK
jgi:tRNA A-37 threonylcarbamoyl transferase component Bud32